MTTTKRIFGTQGEDAALRYLVRRGYHLLERNWRIGHLEVDIIAEHYGIIVFVEVKTRHKTTAREAADAVDREKQANLLEAANAYVQIHQLEKPVRFDIIAVVGQASSFTIKHYEDAFTALSYAQTRHH